MGEDMNKMFQELGVDEDSLVPPEGPAGIAVFPTMDKELNTPKVSFLALADYGTPENADKTNTLADSTLQTLAALPETVTALAFYSDNLPTDTAEELLHKFKSNSDGKFIYQFVNHDTDPVAAREAGITGDGKILLEMGDRKEIAAFASEDELTRSMIRLIAPPLPAASRPSNTMMTRSPVAFTDSWRWQSLAWSLRNSFMYALPFIVARPFFFLSLFASPLMPSPLRGRVDSTGASSSSGAWIAVPPFLTSPSRWTSSSAGVPAAVSFPRAGSPSALASPSGSLVMLSVAAFP
jgi:hypothetical protein